MKVCICKKLSILKDACENIVLVIGVGLAKLNQMKCSCVYLWVMVYFAYLNSRAISLLVLWLDRGAAQNGQIHINTIVYDECKLILSIVYI